MTDVRGLEIVSGLRKMVRFGGLVGVHICTSSISWRFRQTHLYKHESEVWSLSLDLVPNCKNLNPSSPSYAILEKIT